MSEPEINMTPTSPMGQSATNSQTPNSTAGHNNPEWTPSPKVFGAGGNVS